MFSEKRFRGGAWEYLGVKFFTARKTVSVEGTKSSSDFLLQEGQPGGQEPGGPTAGPEVSVTEPAAGSSRWALEPLRNWPSFRNSEGSSRAHPVRVPVTSARIF